MLRQSLNNILGRTAAVLTCALATIPVAAAQEPSMPPPPDNRELERRIDALAAELEAGVGSGSALDRLHFGGYGEVTYRNFDAATDGGTASSESDSFDLHRVVFYIGWDFDDDWRFRSEIEYEHGDEIGVEFAYVEGDLTESVSLHAGNLLVPMGFINPRHEPTTFPSAERPFVERTLLPSTWHENGLGLTGDHDTLHWTAYVLNGFDAAGFDLTTDGFSSGRQGGSQALAEDFALVARLDWDGPGDTLLGGSFWYGDSAQGVGPSDFTTTIVELHGEWRRGPARMRAIAVRGTVDDAPLLPIPAPSDVMEGGYLEGQWDVFSGSPTGRSLLPFVRIETWDFMADDAADGRVWATTVGMAFLPNAHVTFKLDFTDFSGASDLLTDRVAFTIGWAF